MITLEALEKLAKQYQTNTVPNIVREYFQHLLLEKFYQFGDAERLLFKGGTALRMIYGSPRFSEDLDFTLFGVPVRQTKSFMEALFVRGLAEIERAGIEVDIGGKSDATRGGYFGIATFKAPEFQRVGVTINVSVREGRKNRGEVDSVASDFVPTYNVVHLPQNELVEEKVFGALCGRKKPRDFYDLYFMLRRGMLSADQRKRLAGIQDDVLSDARKINFRGELGAFLPANQQAIIRDFLRALEAEIRRQSGR